MMTPRKLAEWIEASRADGDPSGDQLNVSNTWISPTHKYFYMATPKVACSKIKIALQQLEGYELPPAPLRIHWRDTPNVSFVPDVSDFGTEEVVEILTSPDWFRFCFVRDPYSRLFSAYKSQILNLTSPYVGFREAIRTHAGYPTLAGATPGPVGFGDFVRFIGEQSDTDRDGHWKSQTGTLRMEAIEYDFVGRMEFFTRDFIEILRRFGASSQLIASVPQPVNATKRLPLAIGYDKQLADYVYEIYKDDFETFDYARDGWMIDA